MVASLMTPGILKKGESYGKVGFSGKNRKIPLREQLVLEKVTFASKSALFDRFSSQKGSKTGILGLFGPKWGLSLSPGAIRLPFVACSVRLQKVPRAPFARHQSNRPRKCDF